MILILFSMVTLGAVFVATFASNIRRATLALWVAGLGAGSIYLTIGTETLAIVQWIVSTLVAISFVFFSAMLGEYRAGKREMTRASWVRLGLALLIAAGFVSLIWRGAGAVSESSFAVPETGNDLAALGRSLVENHLLSLEVLGLTLFLVLVGGGVIARPEGKNEGVETIAGEVP